MGQESDLSSTRINPESLPLTSAELHRVFTGISGIRGQPGKLKQKLLPEEKASGAHLIRRHTEKELLFPPSFFSPLITKKTKSVS